MPKKKLPPIPTPPKPPKKKVRIRIRGRDYETELRVQKALKRQIEAEKKLKKIREENIKKFHELHPDSRQRVARSLKKLGLTAGKETIRGIRAFRKWRRKKKRGQIGREIRKYIG